jgi:hypothetical protein
MSANRLNQTSNNGESFIQQVFSMGDALIDLTKANALAHALEKADIELTHDELNDFESETELTKQPAQPTK